MRLYQRSLLLLTVALTCGYAQITASITLTIQAEDFTSKQGATFDPPADKESRIAVKDFSNGNWIRFDSINMLNADYDSLRFFYWSSWPQDLSGAVVKIRLDSPTGTTIATFASLSSTGAYGYQPSTPRTIALSAATGVHALVVTVEGGSGSMFAMDKIELVGSFTSTTDDAKTYYVAKYGSDVTNNGLSAAAPFLTIQKAALVMKPGSQCIIRQGIYRETVTPAYTGLPGAPITFRASGNDTVVISGADPISGWSTHSGSIYKASMNWSLGRTNNQILVDGKMAWVARTPNVDETYQPNQWLNWCGTGVYNWKPWQNQLEPVAIPTLVCMGTNGSQWSGDMSNGAAFDMSVDQDGQTANRLPATFFGQPTDFFKGGLITLRNYYYAGVGDITGSTSTSTKTVINGAKTPCQWKDGNGPGFVSYVFGLLDAPNEWYRDSASSTLYLWAPDGGDPTPHAVEAKRRALGFNLRSKSYINITGLRFLATSLTLEDASNCIVDRCHFKYVSHYDNYNPLNTGAGFFNTPFDPSDGTFGIFVSGEHNLISNSSVIGSAGSGVILNGKFNAVNNCRIHSCNYMANYHAGILFMRRDLTNPQDGLGNTATHNSIKGCSRGGIQIGQAAQPTGASDRTIIAYNDFDLNAYASNETGSLAGQGAPGVEVSHNWFHGVEGPQNGDIAQEYDFGARGWAIHHNVFWQGRPLIQGGFTVSFHWWFDWGDANGKCFNNTVISKIVGGHADIDSGWPGFDDGWAAHNIIYAQGDTAAWKFTDARNNDYTLRDGSPAINAGTVIAGWEAATTVPDGRPDLGAYEKGQPRWQAGADWAETPWIYPPSQPAGPGTQGIGGRVMRSVGSGLSLRVLPLALRIEGTVGAPYRVSLFNVKGVQVASHVATRGGTMILPLEDYSAGMYAVRVQSGSMHRTWKTMIGGR